MGSFRLACVRGVVDLEMNHVDPLLSDRAVHMLFLFQLFDHLQEGQCSGGKRHIALLWLSYDICKIELLHKNFDPI